MKQLLTLLFVAFSLGASAQDNRISELRLRLSDGSNLAISLDGQLIARNTNSLTLDGIEPGRHRIEVYRDNGRRSRLRRIITTTLNLSPATYNDGVVDVRMRRLQLHTVAANDELRTDQSYDRYGNRNGTSDRRPNDYDPLNEQSDHDYREGYGSYPRGREGYNSNDYYTPRFSDRDMEDLRSRVASCMMDEDKEKLMEQVLSDRMVSTTQVRQMLGWLTFESTKLEFAKWAYTRASDRRDYWKLEDAFTFESSKDEFNQAISGR
ncbi:MAG: DUF4476 domain-containing protein [Bacteroidetes bacterium]|nr:DUF4476 domain-containing protein [Bacteroidota bacterium]